MLIGLLGIKRSGKDTSAEHLVKEYGFRSMAFADPLKSIASTLFFFNDEQLHGDLKEVTDKEWGVTPRHVFQQLGTEIIRNNMGKVIPDIGENFWVEHTRVKINRIRKEEPNKRIVITDVRFPNEANLIKDKGGIIIKIIRPALKSDDGHASEVQVDEIDADYNIINDSTIEDLYKKIDNIIRECVQ